MKGLRHWGAWPLLAAWMAYWVTLTVVVLGPPAVMIWRLTHDPARHGSATGRFTNDVFAATVADGGRTVWAGSAHLLTIVLWLVVPPLAFYGLWLWRRPARGVDSSCDGVGELTAGTVRVAAGGGARERVR